jgi:uncharacterized protein (TIGR03086 family)
MTDDAAVLSDLKTALAGTGQVVAGVGPGQWTASTPCHELNARALVNHMVGGNLMFTAIVRGEPLPDRTADHLGGDPSGAFGRAGSQMYSALAAPGALLTTYPSPFGQTGGSFLASIRVIEMLTHGWDLARGTGQLLAVPADVAERALAVARGNLTPELRSPAFAPEVTVPGDAPVLDRLAGFLGRPV